jgi:pyruvate dehydrogenase E1 component alpha subunit
MYREMLSIRRFEEKAGQLYGMGLIGGFCHLYIGQEAVVIGMQHAAKQGDAVITTYRDHGHMIACGMDPKGIMAELTGRIGGFSHGKGGSMHMFSVEKNFFGGHGIVGANVPLGTGIAFAQKYKKTDALSMVYFGDGASNQGQVYESFNMASLWQLPVIYIIENNEYAMGTSTKRHAADTELYKRGEAFGIPGIQVDGMDVLKVYEAAAKVIAHVRAGKGPMLMEIKTYRYRGHSMSDPAKYRSKEEVEWAQRSQVDHLGADAFGLEFLRCLERIFDADAEGHDGHIRALLFHGRFTDRYDVLALWHLEAYAVKQFVLEEYHGIGVANGRLEQALCIRGVVRGNHLQPRAVRIPAGIALAMLRSHAACGTIGATKYDGGFHLATAHIQRFGGRVQNLVNRLHGKVPRHELNDWLKAHERGTNAKARKALFGDGGIDHTVRTEFSQQSFRHLIGALILGHFLAHHEHIAITAHFFGHRITQGYSYSCHRHGLLLA